MNNRSKLVNLFWVAALVGLWTSKLDLVMMDQNEVFACVNAVKVDLESKSVHSARGPWADFKWPAQLTKVSNLYQNEAKDKVNGPLAYKSLAYLHVNHWPTCI